MKQPPSEQKLRGGYYTPKDVSDFLATWAIQPGCENVLEPSCGDGSLASAAARRLLSIGYPPSDVAQRIKAIEFDEAEASKAERSLVELGLPLGMASIESGDFFAKCEDAIASGRKFSAVLGNPPFIRYQNFPTDQRDRAFSIMHRAGLHPNKLTNAWLPFLVGSAQLLSEDGRLAMVIPAELFQVGYAAETRKFLSDYFKRITIITFRTLLFSGVQQEVVLLLCEKATGGVEGIRTLEVEDAASLRSIVLDDLTKNEIIPIDHSSEKWTKYFLNASEVMLLRELRNCGLIPTVGDVAEVDVGVVTGLNEYFVQSLSQAEQHGTIKCTVPLVTRSSHLQGLQFSENDWLQLSDEQKPSLLFYPTGEELSESIRRYIDLGERNGVNAGYKCSIRKRWYLVPSVFVPDAFMLRQVHAYPKLILNTSRATCTDTIHRVRFKDPRGNRQKVAAFMNSLTFAFSEVTGRSYGGGVLTFEPSEAEKLLLPLNNAISLDLDLLDSMLRAKDVEAVLAHNNHVLLAEGLGMAPSDIAKLTRIWEKLRDRRMGRR